MKNLLSILIAVIMAVSVSAFSFIAYADDPLAPTASESIDAGLIDDVSEPSTEPSTEPDTQPTAPADEPTVRPEATTAGTTASQATTSADKTTASTNTSTKSPDTGFSSMTAIGVFCAVTALAAAKKKAK